MKQKYGKLTHKGKPLIEREAKIISDNEIYDQWRDKTIIITHADNTGPGYDKSLFPEMLCDFKCTDGTPFPFALYEYEYELI